MKDSVRKAIVDYLELVTGNEKAASLLSEKVINKVDDNKTWKAKGFACRDEIKEFYINYYVSAHVERSLHILANHFLDIM